jgi:hypothetical protein
MWEFWQIFFIILMEIQLFLFLPYSLHEIIENNFPVNEISTVSILICFTKVLIIFLTIKSFISSQLSFFQLIKVIFNKLNF